MGELDYQMALLLQHRFEQESNSTLNEQHTDYELARILQDQFKDEATSQNCSSNLIYYKPKAGQSSSNSLTDPSWELVDPTPDIHMLFMAFNERFFWNKLLVVCVSWSKRMTSCAGICSYNGRGGMCSITLSEPLLKLRPRKDLVETLLHEMIHAFLFVTHNNRDRDGHGPEFHKHMYRINNEARTNITVHHSFHDEVRLYQQHWWRCNGPCQSRKPYFGMVRRATNRAPGPNDRWWREHSRTCSGTFIKVKEPEKTIKNTKKNNVFPGKKEDIRKFVLMKNKQTSSSYVVGFKDLTNLPVKKKLNPTLIQRKQDSTNEKKTAGEINYTEDFKTVRNHWAHKFFDTKKRPLTADNGELYQKSPKLSSCSTPDFAKCPICLKKIATTSINSHLDDCLIKQSVEDEPNIVDLTEVEETKECPMCNENVNTAALDPHLENCVLKSHLDERMGDLFNNDSRGNEQVEENRSQYNCPFCMELLQEKEMQEHIDACLKTDKSLIDDFEFFDGFE